LEFNSATVAEAKKGDKDAFADLYEAGYRELYKIALFTLGNAEDAQDVVSETFMEAYKGIKKIREPSSFKYWILSIFSARCKRKKKEYARQRENLAAFFSEESPDNSLIPYRADERADILRAFMKLKPEEREIVTLTVIYDYKSEEVAQITQMPGGTVRSKLHRSLNKLRTYLAEQENKDVEN
jgi:RNA polymerase sigma-70 factor (ECF subfamily)